MIGWSTCSTQNKAGVSSKEIYITDPKTVITTSIEQFYQENQIWPRKSILFDGQILIGSLKSTQDQGSSGIHNPVSCSLFGWPTYKSAC